MSGPSREDREKLAKALGAVRRVPRGFEAAAETVQNLRTFEERTGRRLTGGQLHVLRCCERMLNGETAEAAA